MNWLRGRKVEAFQNSILSGTLHWKMHLSIKESIHDHIIVPTWHDDMVGPVGLDVDSLIECWQDYL